MVEVVVVVGVVEEVRGVWVEGEVVREVGVVEEEGEGGIVVLVFDTVGVFSICFVVSVCFVFSLHIY